MSERNLSPERRSLHCLGQILTVAGICLLLLAFVGFVSRLGGFSGFGSRSRSTLLTALGGFVCAGVGQLLVRLARAGLAGSALKLDPEEAHHDLEPWSQMSGGRLKDTLDEASLENPGQTPGVPLDEPLRRLDALRRDGLITKAEYAAAKAGILKRFGL